MKNFQQVIKNSWNWISLSKFYPFLFWYVRGAHNVERAERESLRSRKNEENNVIDEDKKTVSRLLLKSLPYLYNFFPHVSTKWRVKFKSI